MTFTPIGQTAQMQAGGSRSAAGRRRGETGSDIKPRNSSEIAEWLSNHTPEQIDKAAVSRASQFGVTLAVKYQTRFPRGPNGERLPAVDFAVGCGAMGSEADRQAVLADLNRFSEPATIRQIEIWLAELSVISASRGREGAEAELMLTAYSSRLAGYPADVARYAVLGRSWKWWPTWQELEAVCEERAAPRRQMIAALKRPEKPAEPEMRPPTQEEKARIAALVAEKFPNVPAAWRRRAVSELTKGNCFEVENEEGAA